MEHRRKRLGRPQAWTGASPRLTAPPEDGTMTQDKAGPRHHQHQERGACCHRGAGATSERAELGMRRERRKRRARGTERGGEPNTKRRATQNYREKSRYLEPRKDKPHLKVCGCSGWGVVDYKDFMTEPRPILNCFEFSMGNQTKGRWERGGKTHVRSLLLLLRVILSNTNRP